MKQAVDVLQLFVLALPVLAPSAEAQSVPVTVDAVANSASYWRAGLNQVGIAQGSLFVVLGSNLGPGTLNVTYDGHSSSSVPVTVAPAAVGIYTLNQGGTGPAAVTTADYQVIGPSFAANPGETLIVWGTGLGAVAGDEGAGPLVGNLGSTEVFVGIKPAVVHYAGRSGCCAGVDQVSFDVPAGGSGCFVPLVVRSHGVAGNFGSIAVAPQGRQCSDPLGLPQSALAKAATGADLRFGAMAWAPSRCSLPSPTASTATSRSTNSPQTH